MGAVDPTVRAARRTILEGLGRWSSPAGYVLSVYFDLDPREFGTAKARHSQLTATSNELTAAIEAAGLPRETRESALGDLARIRERLGTETIEDAEGASALAIFCCGPAGMFEILKIPFPVRPACAVRPEPFLGPVAELLKEQSWCVLLVDRSTARLFLGGPDELEEIVSFDDEVHGQHAQGGWSQARYQRSVEKEVQDHLAKTATLLHRLWQRRPFENLLIGSAEELHPEVVRALHTDLRDRIRGRVVVERQHAPVDEVLEAAQPAIEEHDRARERELLDRLQQELGRGGKAAASPNDVRRALEQKRVEVLLLDDPREAADEIDLALEQAADVLVVRHHDDLRSIGKIAALLRF